VLGDVLLRRPDRLGQLVDGHGPVAQGVEQADAHRLAEHTEAVRDELDERLGQGMGDHANNSTT
jgi:hypothetical protein